MAVDPAPRPASHATEDSLQASQQALSNIFDIVSANVLFAYGYAPITPKPSLDVV